MSSSAIFLASLLTAKVLNLNSDCFILSFNPSTAVFGIKASVATIAVSEVTISFWSLSSGEYLFILSASSPKKSTL